MIVYLDTSCLAKLYFEEQGSQYVKTRVKNAQVAVTSVVAYAEMRSAIERRRRESVLAKSDYRLVLSIFQKEWDALTKLAVNENLALAAGGLAAVHALRGFDSIHLASALYIREQSGLGSMAFLCADKKMNVAAQKEGFEDIFSTKVFT